MKRNYIKHVGLKANGSNLMVMNFGTWVLEIFFLTSVKEKLEE